MSHLTAQDIRNLSQVIDAAIAFLEFTGQREPALLLLLQGLKFFLPSAASLLEISDLGTCSQRYYEEGKLTLDEYQKIKRLLPAAK